MLKNNEENKLITLTKNTELSLKKIKLYLLKSLLIIIMFIIYNSQIIKNFYINKINLSKFNKNINNFNNSNNKNLLKVKIFNLTDLINKLNIYSKERTPKNILISDFLNNEYCDDFNGYSLFEYYLQKNVTDVYYLINIKSVLYRSLLNQNKTKNLIPLNLTENIWNVLFNYLLNSKILIQSYSFFDFQDIISQVPYIKFLHLSHGIRYFKKRIDLYVFKHLIKEKINLISTSPFEYDSLINNIHHSKNYIYKAGLPKYDRFKNIKKNESENDCILISFTYRKYDNIIYEKSLLKKNLQKLLNNSLLISLLKKNKIDLIYIPHHFDIYRHRNFEENKFLYAKFKNNTHLTHFIEQCSLFVTDFSSVSYDFMFQNKPALFYYIDINDTINFEEKEYMQNPDDPIYFGNVFREESKLIEKIKYYIDRKFDIGNKMRKNYNSVFFVKDNIRERITKIVEKIINE